MVPEFANLYKPIHDLIIIPVSSDPLNLETQGKKRKNYKKLNENYLDEQKREQNELFR